MRRYAISALVSLRQARSLSIHGEHRAVVRGVLDSSDAKRSGTALFATTSGSSEETLRVPVVSKIRGLLPAVERALEAYAMPPVELVESTGDDAVWADARVALADPGLVAGAPLDHASSLEWLQSTWAGTNALMTGGRQDFRCSRLSGCFGPLITEYVFGHLLGNNEGSRLLRSARSWAQAEYISIARPPLKGQTLGVLGAGDIGQHVAGVAKAFGMATLGLARDGAPRTNFDEVATKVDEVLRRSDVILSALPSTPATRGLLDGRLGVCTKRPVLINVGRGDLISEGSVIEALDNGWIREAALDVFEKEPLPNASPLWFRDDVFVTPHVAAFSRTDDVARVFAANLDRHFRGEPLMYEVDWEKGY